MEGGGLGSDLSIENVGSGKGFFFLKPSEVGKYKSLNYLMHCPFKKNTNKTTIYSLNFLLILVLTHVLASKKDYNYRYK